MFIACHLLLIAQLFLSLNSVKLLVPTILALLEDIQEISLLAWGNTQGNAFRLLTKKPSFVGQNSGDERAEGVEENN
jgi:hypothetical protein